MCMFHTALLLKKCAYVKTCPTFRARENHENHENYMIAASIHPLYVHLRLRRPVCRMYTCTYHIIPTGFMDLARKVGQVFPYEHFFS